MEQPTVEVGNKSHISASMQDVEKLKQNLHELALFPPPKLTDEQFNFINSRRDKISSCITDREKYIEESGINKDIFGTYWGGDGVECVIQNLLKGERDVYDRLRWVWAFSGFPILNYCRADTFPVIDPIFERYKKLAAASPKAFKITAPPVCGEAGWKVDDGVVNMDVAITQERLLYLYHTGVHDHLAKKASPAILEIGAGSGMFAYGLYKSFPKCRYFICDIPESLLLQFTYLNLGLPDKKHYVAGPNGLFEILGPDQEDRKVKLEDIDDGIIYIPNYMMHHYDKLIKPDLAYNAMSLHEMQPKQIDYYAKMLRRILVVKEIAFIQSFWTMLDNHNGFLGKVWRKINYTPEAPSWKRALAAPILNAFRSLSLFLGYRHGKHGIFFEVNAHRGEVNNINSPYLKSNFSYRKSFDFYDLSLCPTLWTNDKNLMNNLEEKYNHYQRKYDLDGLYQIDAPFQNPETPPTTLLRMMDEDFGDILKFNFTEWVNKNQYFFADHLAGYRRRFPSLV
ncbi:MAG: putative sugar O-methyltransferase [Pseudomonadota bacterium]